MTDNEIAIVCHEANAAYCRTLGDGSQPSWADAPQWQKDSAVNGVEHAKNADARPWDSHETWLREKVEAGWVFGPVKDPEKKTHPCCMPYHELPPEQQKKDVLFLAVARALF